MPTIALNRASLRRVMIVCSAACLFSCSSGDAEPPAVPPESGVDASTVERDASSPGDPEAEASDDETAKHDVGSDARAEPTGDGADHDAAHSVSDASLQDAASEAAARFDGGSRDGAKDAATQDANLHDAGGFGGLGYACTGAMPSLAKDVWPILATCTGEMCHGGGIFGPTGPTPAWGGAANVHAYFVNKPATRDTCAPGMLVTPGDLTHSYLMNKMTGIGMCPGTMTMPRGVALPRARIQTIADWICSGAPDN